MTTSAKASRMPALLKKIKTDVVSAGTLAFSREYFRNLVFQEILFAFKAAHDEGLTRSELARRIKRSPEQITRWLKSPGNIEIDSLCDLLSGMGTKPESILRRRELPEATPVVADLLSKLSTNYEAIPVIGTPTKRRLVASYTSLFKHPGSEGGLLSSKRAVAASNESGAELNVLGELTKRLQRSRVKDKELVAA